MKHLYAFGQLLLDNEKRAESLRDAEVYERLRKSLPPGDTRSAACVLADAIVAAREGKL